MFNCIQEYCISSRRSPRLVAETRLLFDHTDLITILCLLVINGADVESHGFPGLFTDTSEHIRFFSLLFLFSTVSFPRCRLILLMKVFDLIQNSIPFHVV